MTCRLRHNWLDPTLSEDERTRLTQHQLVCPECARDLQAWQKARQALQQQGQAWQTFAPTPAQVQNLLYKLDERSRQPAPFWRWAVVGALAALLLAMIIFPSQDFAPPDGRATVQPEITSLSQSVLAWQTDSASRLRFVEDGWLVTDNGSPALVNLGTHRIGLNSGGRAFILKASQRKVELELETGTLSLDVAFGPERGELSVSAGPYRVEVLGTQFSVVWQAPDQFQVIVVRGRVAVQHLDGETHLVAAGQIAQAHGARIQVLEAAREELNDVIRFLKPPAGGAIESEKLVASPLPEPPVPKTLPGPPPGPNDRHQARTKLASHGDSHALATWRQWVAEGRCGEAVPALTHHLKERPQSFDEWTLLAACHRKEGRFQAAL